MRDFFKEYKWDGRPWLIVGKGPSSRPPSVSERAEYNTIALNHVVRETQVDISHIIDLDVVDQLGEKLYENCEVCLMPYYPHFCFRPNEGITLDDISRANPILKRLGEEGRLYGYNLSTASQHFNKVWNESPLVWASFFSAEAVVNLLGKLGVKQIKTLGVDGGKGQANQFSNLQNINKNGYDTQWNGIRKSIRKYNLDYAPLGVESPIRVFIGAGDEQIIPALVLKYSILKHATMSVDVTIMNEWTHPMPKDRKNWPRTPFSFQRFMIPEKCNYQGHAIYMDSDMLVFGDVKEIWTADLGCRSLWTMRNDDIDKHRAKYSVFLMDCSKLTEPITTLIEQMDNSKLSYDDLVFNFIHVQERLDGFNPDWNSLEEYTEGKTKLLHYTEMYNQPWHANPNHPLAHLWLTSLKHAFACGEIDEELLKSHVERGWIVPKCLEVLNDPLPEVV